MLLYLTSYTEHEKNKFPLLQTGTFFKFTKFIKFIYLFINLIY